MNIVLWYIRVYYTVYTVGTPYNIRVYCTVVVYFYVRTGRTIHICIIVQYLVEVDRLPVTYGHEASLTRCLPKISRALAFVKLSSTNASVEIVIH